MLTQSLAILKYLDEARPEPALLPVDSAGRARVRALAYAIAMQIHPVCNTSVSRFGVSLMGGENALKAWMHRFTRPGLEAVERLLEAPETGHYCHGDGVIIADLCLIPQIYNARCWSVPFADLARISAIAARLKALPAFASAHPDQVGPPPA